MNIKKYNKNIFLIKQNKEYESFINTFNKIYDKNINQKNSYIKKHFQRLKKDKRLFFEQKFKNLRK